MNDVSNHRDVRAAIRAAKALEAEHSATLKWIMSTISGRKWIHDHLESLGIGRTPWTPDPYATSFNCGQQNAGLKLWGELQSICPDLYVLMMQESHERNAADDSRRSRDHADPDGGYRADPAGGEDADAGGEDRVDGEDGGYQADRNYEDK